MGTKKKIPQYNRFFKRFYIFQELKYIRLFHYHEYSFFTYGYNRELYYLLLLKMTEITEKYLTLRGANNDIYFFQKRVSEKVADIIGTSFVKTSLKTKDLSEAISSRDELVDALNQLENSDILDISDNLRSILDGFGISILKKMHIKNLILAMNQIKEEERF